MNKNELVLLITIILLLELNSVSQISIDHITFSSKKQWIAYIICILSFAYTMYIYHSVCHSTPSAPISFSVDTTHNISTCQDLIQTSIDNKQQDIQNLKTLCEAKLSQGVYYSEKVVLTFIVIMILVMVIMSIANKSFDANSFGTKTMYAIPILLLACSVSLFTHIYIPFYN